MAGDHGDSSAASGIMFFPVGFAVLSLVVPSTIRNLRVSFTVPQGFIVGVGAISMLIGTMGDTATFAALIFIATLLISFGIVLSRFLKKPE